MFTSKKNFLAVICTLLSLVLLLGLVGCEAEEEADDDEVEVAEFPSEPIEVVVPYSAGGGRDTLARAFTSVAGDYLDVPIRVVNMPGAQTAEGAQHVLDSPADGHTMLLIPDVTMCLTPQLHDVPYNYDDFRGAVQMAGTPQIWAVAEDAPWESFSDLIEYIEENPGEVNHGHAGTGTSTHMATELLANQLDLDIRHTSFDGSAESLMAVARGEMDFAAPGLGAAAGPIEAGDIRPIAATTPERIDLVYPDLPTAIEEGYDYSYMGRSLLLVPADTPDENVEYLEEVFFEVFEDETYIELAEDFGEPPVFVATGAEVDEMLKEVYEDIKPVAEEMQE